ncbi:Optic atrophy 3 protein (OPA3) family protein [Theileria parva strain Muguga]|uniref:Uncharacterized protein n=1 Tax=Theileria parva TaxID=5875 RepID=Q4N3K8_THEPA|nr:Optic atrophy 3 protein (OPA3) family protein [Theileria parva strain Muguga]EAN31986.1 Optic atrophy 3 protein (OPA3) family protein [Theileria parva strain Muguga]|eukprot:XP_764269.1 hypothetical protein [Theileria parva strain Muguga]
MEILVEFLRTLTANLSKHTTSVIKTSVNHSKLIRSLVIKIGTSRHKTKVNLLLWGSLWKLPFLKKSFTDATSRVEVIIKPIEDSVAIDIGTEILAEFLLLTTMVSTMCYSIYLRRSRYNVLLEKQENQESKILSRIEYIEQEISKLFDFKSKIDEIRKE